MDQKEENNSSQSSDEASVNSTQLKTLMMCPICKKGFPTPSKVKRHLLAVHEKIREFQCDICSHAFSQKIHVLKHRQAVHKKELEANPDLLAKKDFRIPDDGTVTPQKHSEAFNTPFQTMKVDKTKKSSRKKVKSHTVANAIKPLVSGTTETKVYFELRVDPQVLNIDLSKLTAIEPSSITASAANTTTITTQASSTEFNQNKPITCQVKIEPVNPDNQLTLDESKFDLNKLIQQESFDSDLEKTLAQLQPIAKEFAAFEEDQGGPHNSKIFQELVPLSDIKPTIAAEFNKEEVVNNCKVVQQEGKVRKKSSHVSCDLCRKNFSSPSKLRRHVRIVHEKIKPFNCHVCGKNFGQKVNLIGHLQSKHKLSEEESKANTHQVVNQEDTNNTSSNSITTSHESKDDNRKIFKCMECVFDSEDSGDMISHHLSTHVQTMFNFDTSELLLE